MKKKLFVAIAIISFAFIACNSDDKTTKQDDKSKMNKDSMQTATQSDADVATVTPTFANLDAKISGDINAIVSHYLHLKNALANDNNDEASAAAKAMSDALAKVDKSFFTPEQKKVYDDVEEDLKEHAEHISKSKIDHQREHFSMMSEDIYDLVKAFGGGQTLYHDHCPMANDQKGGMWLSEMKEVKNPYFGGKMNECVKVMEVLK